MTTANPRIVSLIPSATEIVAALGFTDSLVGRSHECDFPAAVASRPVLTAPKVPLSGSSGDIQRAVSAVLEDALAVYRVDAEALRGLRPDAVVTQSQCDVCAVSLSDVQAALADWTEDRPQLIDLHPMRLADLWVDIERVATALGVPERGRDLIAGLKARVEAIAARAAALPDRPSVVTIEWTDPLMAGGNWMPELIDRAGGRELLGRAGEPSHWITWEELEAADPDVIMVNPCGFTLDRVRGELAPMTGHPAWSGLRAVAAGRVFLADGHHYFNRPGPRLVESVEILAELLHPGVFDFGHEGRGWTRYGG